MKPWLLAIATLALILTATDSPVGRGLRGALHAMEALPRWVREHETRTKVRRSEGPQGVGERTNERTGDGPARDVGGGMLVSGGQYGYGPQPLNQLLGRDDSEDDEDDEGEVEEELPPRRLWVAQQLRAGTRPTDIKQVGAQLYGVTTRTIDNDIASVRRGG